jgi:hypothetical protein
MRKRLYILYWVNTNGKDESFLQVVLKNNSCYYSSHNDWNTLTIDSISVLHQNKTKTDKKGVKVTKIQYLLLIFIASPFPRAIDIRKIPGLLK